jgi:predicted RNA-binding protein YlxR (DUF448 family)
VTFPQSLEHADDERPAGRERRCIVTGEVLPESRLVRFVADPDGRVVPDVAAKLPGRGMWVAARGRVLDVAVRKNQFSRAAKAQLTTPADLVNRVEQLLAGRMLEFLGLARRSGGLILGFDAVLRSFREKNAPDLLVEAADGSRDGRAKLLAGAAALGVHPAVIDCLYSSELSLALGRENVVHAAAKRGRFSERLKLEAGRLEGFRPAPGTIGSRGLQRAGESPALDEGRE